MAIDIEVDGLDELEAKLLELDKRVATRVVRGALRKSGQIVADSAKTKVPVDSGALKESIGTIARKGKGKRTFQSLFVAPRERNKSAVAIANTFREDPIKGIFYGHIVEKGYGRQRPQPFLRPALDENVNEVVETFSKALNEAIKRVTRNGNT